MATRRTPTAHNGNGTNGHKPVETPTVESQAEMIVRVLEDANRIGLDRWVALAEGAAGGAASAAAAGGGVYGANQRGGLQGWGATSWPSAGSGAYAGVVPSSQDHNPKPIPEMEEISPDKPSLLNYGVAGTSFFGSIIQSDEYNPEFGWRSAVLKYEEMRRNDGQVRAIERVVTLPLLSAKWSIKPASDDPMDQEIASFVESCLFHDMEYTSLGGVRITQTWHDILRHILLCVSFGFSPMEKCFRIEDGWVKWSKWQPLLPRTVWHWWVDRDNTLDGIQQWAYKDYTYQFTNIPRGKLLLFSFGQEGDNYEGVSMFRSTWKHWYYKSNFEKLVAIGVERNGVIPPIIYVGPTASPGDVAAALKLEANLRTNEAMGAVLPHDWKLEYPRIYQNHAEATLPLMQYYDILMARSVLAQFINLGSSETGAYSLDKSQVQTFLMLEQSIADSFASTINNDAIRELVDFNYEGVAVYPELECARLTAQNLASLADLMPALQLYLPPSPELTDYFSDMLGLPVPQQSQVESTNPTAEGTPGQQGGQGQGGAQRQQGKMSPQAAAGVKGGGGSANAGSEDDTTPDYQSPGSGDSSYAEYADDDEALLFREALLAAYGHDAVERGVTWQFGYSTQPRDANGRYAPTGNTGHSSEGEGGSGGGGRGGGSGAPRSGGRARGNGGGGTQKVPTEKAARAPRKTAAERNAEYLQHRHDELDAVRARVGGKGAGTKAESIHERSARLQREGGLKAEVTPDEAGRYGQRLQVQPNHGLEGREFNPAAPPDTQVLVPLYGEHQLGAALSRYGQDMLKQTAAAEGVAPGRTKADTVSRITAHVTEGRYSANFSAGGKTAGATARTGGEPHRMTAEERAAAGLKAEVRPGSEQVEHYLDKQSINPFQSGRQSVEDMKASYGEHQLGAALHNLRAETLHGAANEYGIKPGRTRGETISRITAHVTEGRYSANFGGKGAETGAKGTSAAKGEQESMRAELERLRTENETLKAGRGTAKGARAEKATKQPEERLKPEWTKPGGYQQHGLHIDPFHVDPYLIRAVYGDHQFARGLRLHMPRELQRTARELGIAKVGRTKEEAISRIVAHVQRDPIEVTRQKVLAVDAAMRRDGYYKPAFHYYRDLEQQAEAQQ